MKAANLNLSSIKEGDVHAYTKTITQEDVMSFANLTGDFNPLHVDKEFGEKSQFKKNIVHGMLAGSMFSTIVGMHCPGERALYISQTLNFRKPIFYGDVVTVKGTVTAKNEGIQMITLKTEIIKEGKACIDGEAKIRLIEAAK